MARIAQRITGFMAALFLPPLVLGGPRLIGFHSAGHLVYILTGPYGQPVMGGCAIVVLVLLVLGPRLLAGTRLEGRNPELLLFVLSLLFTVLYLRHLRSFEGIPVGD